jgi:hypothetical protein
MLRPAGQLTMQGPVRPGGRGGGIRAAWREIETEQQQTPNNPHSSSSNNSQSAGGRKKRKIKSVSSNGSSAAATADRQGHQQQQIYNNSLQSVVEPYHTMGLYRGRCPPEEPPFTCGDGGLTADDQELFDSLPLGPLDPDEDEPVTTPTKTLPRYYYYSESDDYGVSNRQRSLSGQRGQRHLSRNHRTQQQLPHRSPTFSDELPA